LSVRAARAIRAALPQARLVGVFADQALDDVVRISRDCGLDFIQLHGHEDVEFCSSVRELSGIPLIKAFEVAGWRDLEEISNFTVEHVSALLIDSPRRSRRGEEDVEGHPGGRGTEADISATDATAGRASPDPAGERAPVPFHWLLAAEAKKLGKPVFVAGGLTPDTVASVVETVGPFGVDVSSGVEFRPGEKSQEKIALFVRRAEGGASVR
jgi:phosphoribosylanthranilate isomerase